MNNVIVKRYPELLDNQLPYRCPTEAGYNILFRNLQDQRIINLECIGAEVTFDNALIIAYTAHRVIYIAVLQVVPDIFCGFLIGSGVENHFGYTLL